MNDNKTIYIDLTGLNNRHWTGVEQFGLTFAKTLSEHFKQLEVKVLVLHSSKDTRPLPDLSYIDIGRNRGRLITDYIVMPLFLLKYKPEYIVFPIFPPSRFYWIIKHKKTNIVTVIHDVVPWEYRQTMSFIARIILVPRYYNALKKSYMILTVSETEKAALQQLNPNVHIKCVYSLIINNILSGNTSIIDKLPIRPKKYILSVSTLEPRKNFHYTLTVLLDFLKSRNDLQIVLIGRSGWGDTNLSKIYRNVWK